MKIALCQMSNAGSMPANLDKSLRAIQTAAQNGAEYVDLTKTLESTPNKLTPKSTNDGLHLNGPGYRAWVRAIQHLVKQ